MSWFGAMIVSISDNGPFIHPPLMVVHHPYHIVGTGMLRSLFEKEQLLDGSSHNDLCQGNIHASAKLQFFQAKGPDRDFTEKCALRDSDTTKLFQHIHKNN